jgi:nucleotide-binding universal stress UspA family protein
MEPVFAHITVPVDGSTASERGVTFALELARDGGHVSVCSVVDPTLACAPAAVGAGFDPGPMLDVLDHDAALFCSRAHDLAKRGGIASDTRVLHGQCISEIESFAAHNGSDAIVIGTHGRSGMARTLLGSVAEGVLRRAHIPVVSVHEDDEMRTGPLAVAMDASPAARAALDIAIAIARARGMSLKVLHSCDASPDPLEINAMLDDAEERAQSLGVRAKAAVHEGKPADVLLRACDANDCSMIVMGTHGRSPLARMALGSVAAAVVERAHVPVVTVKCPV